MPVPETPDLTIVSVVYDQGVFTIDFFEERDVTKTSMMRRQLSVAAELVPEEAEETFSALRDLLSAMQVVHRNPPQRMPG